VPAAKIVIFVAIVFPNKTKFDCKAIRHQRAFSMANEKAAFYLHKTKKMNQPAPFALWFERQKSNLLRWSLALVYLWFGALKFVPGLSPADALAKDTVRVLTFGLIPDAVNLLLLAIWEVGIGLIFCSGRFVSFGVKAAVVHIVLTFTPLFFFPALSFTHVPYGFTLVGQYIVKNVVFLVALGILWDSERKK